MDMQDESRPFSDVPNGSWTVLCMMHNECVNLLVNCKKGILERALLRSCWQRDHSLGTLRSDSGLRSLTLMLCRRGNRRNMMRARIRGLCDAGSAQNISREVHGPLALLRNVWQQTPRHAKIPSSPSLNNLYMQVRPIFRNVASASHRM